MYVFKFIGSCVRFFGDHFVIPLLTVCILSGVYFAVVEHFQRQEILQELRKARAAAATEADATALKQQLRLIRDQCEDALGADGDSSVMYSYSR